MSNKKTNQIISKDTIARLVKDIVNINKTPLHDNNIYYSHDETDMLKGYAMIVGPSETPYQYGYYFFELNFPTDYPSSPPLVLYKTNGDKIRFNPNLYTNEKVCISILNSWRGDSWSSCQTISTVLLTLCTLLCNDPLLNEPGITKEHKDMTCYNKIIEYKNIDIAINRMLKKEVGIFQPQFERFYPIMEEQYKKNKNKIIEFIEKKISEQTQGSETVISSFYGMNVIINYLTLK